MKEFESGADFLGHGWSFPPQFDKYGKRVKMVSAEEDIEESLRILLSTAPGERVMFPTYGCRLKTMIFETLSEVVIAEIQDAITRAVLFFEPRIELNDVIVGLDDLHEGLLHIQLEYTVRATNSRSNMVYPFYFLEGTNISSGLSTI
jgi:phage baseplate assembly protein W